MACGNLVKVLLHTKVTRYLEFKSIAGSFVYREGKIHKVPATPKEATWSSLLSMGQKVRYRGFLQFVDQFDLADASTYKGADMKNWTVAQLFKYYKLDSHTQMFTGHACALYADDEYLKLPAHELLDRIKLYAYSVARYGQSPYIYPLYGLGGLPEGFSRLAAIHGGIYMLNKPIFDIKYDGDGKVTGVESTNDEGEGKAEARCKMLLGDPSYFEGTDKVKKTGQVVRCICILSHPLPNTKDAESAQIIIPAAQVGRKNDIYISCVSFHHQVCAKGKYVAVISTNVESKDPHTELIPALRLLDAIDEEFCWVSDTYEAANDPSADNVYITNSYDASTHFETASVEVVKLYKQLTGETLDLSISADPEDLQDMGE
jgi:Rab GDP dissociation inhibitor